MEARSAGHVNADADLFPQPTVRSPRHREYWLPTHVRVCHTVAGLVFLDLLRNRYLGLSRRESALLSKIARELATRGDEPLPTETSAEAKHVAEALVSRGLLSRAPSRSVFITREHELVPATRPLVPDHDRLSLDSPQIVAAFAIAHLRARWKLRRTSLFEIATDLAERRLRSETNARLRPEYDLVTLLKEFHRLRGFLFTAKDRCLLNALSLVDFLSRFGHFPMWVIGVRVKPWGAHSWVQLGDTVLDGSVEHVLEYTPILVV